MSPNGAIKFAKWRHLAPDLAPRGAAWRHLAIANLRHSPNLGDTWRYRHVAMVHSLKKSMRKIFIAKWRHMAPFGDKCSSSQMAPNLAKFRQTSPYGAIWRGVAKIIDELTIYFFDFNALQSRTVAIRRHVAPRGAIWRKITIWFQTSPDGAIWRQSSPNGAINRQITTSPNGANHRHSAPIIAIWRQSSPNGAIRRQTSPSGANHRQMAPFGANHRQPTYTSKQPIRTRYLCHVTGYQPIRDQHFLIRSVPVHYIHLSTTNVDISNTNNKNIGRISNRYLIPAEYLSELIFKSVQVDVAAN